MIRNFVGLDMASDTFSAALGTGPWQLLVRATEFANDVEGFVSFREWLHQHQCAPTETVVCLEATGVYGEGLAYFLVAQGYRVAIEPPLKVKRAFATTRHKNDRVDAEQITEYACRFVDELSNWRPRAEVLEQIQVLLTTREQLVRQKAAHQAALQALRRKPVQTPLANQVHAQQIAWLKEQIQSVNQELQRLTNSHPDFRQFVQSAQSLPGVGPLLSAHLLVLQQTQGLPLEAKTLAAYIGISPVQWESGTSVRRQAHSRGYGPTELRKLLHLAARSISTHHPLFRQYYLRKLAEGKQKKLALNNVANKLLKILCAVLRTRTRFNQNYRSVQPLLFS